MSDDQKTEPKWGSPEWHRLHPIFLTVEDMQKPKKELIEKIRRDLGHIRGQIRDVYCGFGWKDRLDSSEHGLTLVIVALHVALEEMKKIDARKGEVEP